MIALRTAIPTTALKGFVRVYAQREVSSFESGAVCVAEPIPARLEQTLEFQLGVPYTVHLSHGDLTAPEQVIIGAHVNGAAAQIDLQPGIISFAVFFTATGLSQLFGIPVSEISQRNYDAALISARMRTVRERLGGNA